MTDVLWALIAPARFQTVFNFFCMLLLASADFCKINFFKTNRSGNDQSVKRFDTDHYRRYVGPGLGLNCLQRLSIRVK